MVDPHGLVRATVTAVGYPGGNVKNALATSTTLNNVSSTMMKDTERKAGGVQSLEEGNVIVLLQVNRRMIAAAGGQGRIRQCIGLGVFVMQELTTLDDTFIRVVGFLLRGLVGW